MKLADKRNSVEDRQFEDIVKSQACWKTFVFRSMIKKHEYNGKHTRRCNVTSIQKINFANECRRLLEEIGDMGEKQ